jgi:hypothetical protein
VPNFNHVIARAYLEILDRPPDPGGLSHYRERMSQGLSEAELREILLRSPEYAERNPDLVGALRIHPRNPHYFEDPRTGQPVLIASYSNIVPTSTNFDYVADIEERRRNRIGYCRVWHFLPWEEEAAIWPWERSGTPGAYMGGRGGNKFDLDVFNPIYWSRMRDALLRAYMAGIRAQIHLFDRVAMSPGDDSRWGGNPWAAENNVNDLEVPSARPPSDGTPDFYFFTGKPRLRSQQERYVRKMIDETIAFPSVFYEIENEHWQDDRTEWATHYGQFVKDHIAANYPDTPRLVSYSSLEPDLEALFDAPAIDVINKHFGNEVEDDPALLNDYLEPRWPRNKPINVDEFANGVTDTDLLREMCWTILTSGGHFHVEDAEPASDPFGVVERIRLFLVGSSWDFLGAAPNRQLVTSGRGYCMAQTGVEYVCYFPEGGSPRLVLPPGEYHESWWDPRVGAFARTASFSHPGGERELTTPDERDWALQLVS